MGTPSRGVRHTGKVSEPMATRADLGTVGRSLRLSIAAVAICLVCSSFSTDDLGGVDAGDLGASHQVVAACDPTIDTTWAATPTSPVYSGSATLSSSTFNVDRLLLTGVDAACNGLSYSLTLADVSNAAILTQTGTLAVSGGNATITFATTDSKTIELTAMVIHG